MIEWSDEGFALPTDPGPVHKAILRVWYCLEDWWSLVWRSFNRMDKNTVIMAAIALAIWIILALVVPGSF